MELDIEHQFLFILQAMFKKTQSLKNIVKKLRYRHKIEHHYKIVSTQTGTLPHQNKTQDQDVKNLVGFCEGRFRIFCLLPSGPKQF